MRRLGGDAACNIPDGHHCRYNVLAKRDRSLHVCINVKVHTCCADNENNEEKCSILPGLVAMENRAQSK